ncbi:hypothetical protein HUR95_05905 [Caldalkalibacillus thermarum TA2.A1]|uniref:Uncharacterized protein n=1 Tax=Caldalkalibacillus thermarum (strain TA2.A1) TaxID=986075 RepID=A0A8X8I612_CALTT|nr:hypothetical protein [Caldalkalibacillus thermarum]QZT34800.1 hypothetical protein HUR95_05905 [Caldalkalibacillus thermarum TA2.A1]
MFDIGRVFFIILAGSGLLIISYLSGLGLHTVAEFIGISLNGSTVSIVVYGLLINLVLLPTIFHLNRRVINKKIETIFPLESFRKLSKNDKLFIAGLLHKQYKKLNQHIYKLLKEEMGRGSSVGRKELSFLFNRRDLSRYFCNKIANEKELSRPDLEILNLLFDPDHQVKFEVIHLSRLHVEYRNKPEEKLEKINELKALGYKFLDGFGFIKVHYKN